MIMGTVNVYICWRRLLLACLVALNLSSFASGVNVCVTGQSLEDVLLSFNPINTTTLSCTPNPGDHSLREIPSEIGLYSFVEAIDFSRPAPPAVLEGNVPTQIGSLSALTKLELEIQEFDGELPTELGNLAALEHLEVFRNGFEGQIPSHLGNLEKLTLLDLEQNAYTGSVPAQLGRLNNLKILYISRLENRLLGGIPSELGLLSELTELYLDQVGYSGTLPETIYKLTKLQVLRIGVNLLEGTLSSGIGNLTNLRDLRLQSNKFGGTFPVEIGRLDKLIALFVGSNQFFGTMPNHSATFFDVPSGEFLGKPPQDEVNVWFAFIALAFGALACGTTCIASAEDVADLGTKFENKFDAWVEGL